MIVSVVRAFKWTPSYVVNELYVSGEDYFSLDFWYKDVQQQIKDINAKK